MHSDPALPYFVAAILAILVIGLLLRGMRQPHVIAYLATGVIVGPHGLGLVTDEPTLSRVGALGVVLLLFFVGMEVTPHQLAARWRVAVIGVCLQVIVSIGCVWLIGLWLAWPIERVVAFGFVITLSSTAVVLKLLEDWKELDTKVGQDVLAILLVQDLAIIPMLVVIVLMGKASLETGNVMLPVIGGVALLAFLVLLVKRTRVRLPLASVLRADHEMQIFAALAICFGFASLTALCGLSPALGAFAAGMLIGAARETQWIHYSLEPFRVVFVALFFMSVGLVVDLRFIWAYGWQVTALVIAVVLMNTLINAGILRSLGDSWRNSLYAGALLSQIGEFSFVLIAAGLQMQIVSNFGYQLTLAVISISLLLSPIWIALVKALLRLRAPLPV